MDRSLIVASMRATPGLLRALASDCAPEQEWAPPRPGEWSIGDVVRHLVEGERDTFLPRLRRMLTETRPALDGRRPAPGDRADLKTLLDAFEAARTESAKILAGLGPDGWRREGVSPSRGSLSVETYALTMAEHDTEHLRQIHDVRGSLGLRPRRCEARRPLSIGELVATLEAAPPWLSEVAGGLTAEALRRRPAAGGWGIKEVMAHLAHVEAELFLPRLRRIAAEERPAFEPFSPEGWARARDHREGSFAADLEVFMRARRDTVAFLQSLPPASADRIGLSGFFGPVTLCQYATHVADHDLEHLAQMRACRQGHL